MIFKPAPESSNLIWKNQSTDKSSKNRRRKIAYVIVGLIFSIQIMAFFYLNHKSNEYEELLP